MGYTIVAHIDKLYTHSLSHTHTHTIHYPFIIHSTVRWFRTPHVDHEESSLTSKLLYLHLFFLLAAVTVYLHTL